MSDGVSLRSVLKALSGDEQVDWDAAERSASQEDSRLLLQELKIIAQISAAHVNPGAGARVLPFRLAPDSQWGALRVMSLLGTGADGDVYRAYDERLQREVALKLQRRPSAAHSSSHALNEARLLARLRHPNIVTVHGADIVEGRVGVWMELVTGETLQALVARQGPLAAHEAAAIGAEVCRGLAAIHEEGIHHRDLKAQNVMRGTGGRIVVMDFSASRAGESPAAGLAGTPVYVAPELFGGASPSIQSDIYSVGVLLFYLVTGSYPVNGGAIADIAEAHEDGRVRRLRDVRADLPAAFVAAVDQALARDPSHRPKSAGELENLLPQPVSARGAAVASPRERWSRRTVATIAAVILVAAAGARTWWPATTVPPAASVPLEARPWTLVAAFDNRTGGGDLDGVMEHALERELIEPGFPLADRVRAVLDSGLPEGRVAELPASAAGDVANVTTRSRRALRLYSAAADLMQGAPPWRNADAETLLREAIADDQSFASAHILLGHALANLGKPRADVLAAAERARELAGSTREAERLFIDASAHHLRAVTTTDDSEWPRELAQAALGYEALIRMEPNHPWASNNLASTYQALRRDADVIRVREQAARTRPLHLVAQSWAAMELFRAGELDRAASYIARATSMVEAMRDPDNAFHSMWLSLAPAQQAWLADSPAQALRIVDRVAGQVGSLTPAGVRLSDPAGVNHSRHLVAMYLALGRLAQAERVAMAEPSDDERHHLRAVVLAHRQDAAESASLMPAPGAPLTPWLRLAALPLPNALFKAAPVPRNDAQRPALAEGGEFLLAARVAIAHDRIDEGLALLQRAKTRMFQRGPGGALLIAMLQSEIWTDRGDVRQAIGIMEAATKARTHATFGASTGAMWLHARARLAELYRRAGRLTDAQSIEAQLRKLLVVADDDHPIKQQLSGS